MWVSHGRLSEACLSRRRCQYLILPGLIVKTWLLPVCTLLFCGLSRITEGDWPSDIGLRGWHPQPWLGSLRIKSHLVGERLAVNLPDRSLNAGLPGQSSGIRRDSSGVASVGGLLALLRALVRRGVVAEPGVSTLKVCWLLRSTVRNKVVRKRAVFKRLSLLLSLALVGVYWCKSSEPSGHSKSHGLAVGFGILLEPLASIDASHRLLVVEAELLNLLGSTPTIY